VIERLDGLADHLRFDQRKVTLHVDDDVALQFGGDLRDTIRPGPVRHPRHPRDASECLDSRRDPAVVGGDNDRIHTRCRGDAPIDVLDHRATGDVGKNLGGAAGRVISGGDDGDGMQQL
jgi:hypothetical protein